MSKKRPTKKPERLENPNVNTALICGEVANEPIIRELPSGDVLVAFDVRVRLGDQPACSVPVSWIGSNPNSVPNEIGQECLVIGSVNRRFYQAGGGLQSRVDVRASKIVLGGPVKKRNALARFLEEELSPD